MQFWVYILRCRDGSYYAGHTDNLEKRLAEHRQGLASSWTRGRLPVELLWTELAPSREEALAFERRVKNWSRVKKESLIAGDWGGLSYFARPPHERPSTSLGTNEPGNLHQLPVTASSFVPTEAQGYGAEANPEQVNSFVPSAVEERGSEARLDQTTSFVPSEVEGRSIRLTSDRFHSNSVRPERSRGAPYQRTRQPT